MEGERQAADVDVSAVGVRGEHPRHRSCLRFGQLELIELLGQARDTCQLIKKKKKEALELIQGPSPVCEWARKLN